MPFLLVRANDFAFLCVCFYASVSPVECLRTLSEPLSREPFRSPSDRDDLISLCLSLLFTCRYCKEKTNKKEEVEQG